MKELTAKQIYDNNIKKQQKLIEEIQELKQKLEKAEEAFEKKAVELLHSGKMQSGGYIVTGDEDEDFMQTYREMQEYEEKVYLGAEKAAVAEIKGQYVDKLLQYDSFIKELMISKAALDRENANEPGGEDE